MHKFAIVILPDTCSLSDDPTSLYNAANEMLFPYKIPHFRQPRYDEFREPLWDWWVLGGKWSGLIRNEAVSPPGCMMAFFPKMNGNQDVLLNTALVRDIPETLIPQIIVNYTGQWLTDPKASIEPIDSKEAYPPIPPPSEKWIKQIRYIYSANADNVAVAADIHLPDRTPLLPEWARTKK